MSTPTPPDGPREGWQQPGQGAQPPSYGSQPPAYGSQPPAWGQPGPGNAPLTPGGYTTGARPPQVTSASVIGIVIGGLSVLLNVVGLLAASSVGVEISGFGIVLTVIGIAVSLALLVGGIRTLKGGRPELLLYGAFGVIAIWVLTLALNIVLGNGFTASGLLGLIGAGAIVFLVRQPPAQQWFASRGTP